MNKATSGGSLNIMVQPTPTPIVKGTQTNFTVSFEQKGGSVVQPHIDYDVTITKDGKRVFQASALGGGIIKGTSDIAHPTTTCYYRYCYDTLYISRTRLLHNERHGIWNFL